MKFPKFVSLAALLIALPLASRQAVAADLNHSDRIVVMISVDGLAGFYLDDPKAEMLNIRALAAEGARASSMKAVTPSVTWPNHTTLVTGVPPAVHGVVGNNYYDRVARQRVTLIADPVYDKDQIVKVPTIYDLAKSNGMKTATIRWPASRNAKTLDWTIPDVSSDELLRRYTTPSLVEECEKVGMNLLNNSQAGETRDALWTQAFNFILQKHRPQLALLHIANVDHTQHSKGPRSREAYAVIKESDAQVGVVWNELKRDFPGKATLFVVSDHGFSPIKRVILPNVILRQAGLSGEKIKGKKATDSPVQVVAQGGTAMVYILDAANRDMIVEKIAKAFRKIKEVRAIIRPDQLNAHDVANPKDDPHAPDMLLFAELGYVFGDTASGDLPFEEKPERLGSHGHDPSIPDLHATFVAWGAGIKPGVKLGEIENTSVAPTIAKLLHVSFPPSVKSAPLSAILTE